MSTCPFHWQEELDLNENCHLNRYWFGTPNQDLRNLATCIWRSQEDAKKGSVGPDHRRAAMSARHHYSEWNIDQHRLIIRDGAASWDISKW